MDDDAQRVELSSSLRQLCHPDLEPLFWLPERCDSLSAWWGHVPFAHWIMCATRPRVFVELGTDNGVSYTAFCQAVLRCELDTRCYAVDTWESNEQASFYGQSVYEDLSAFHDRHYAAFSTLVRCTFDEALDHIEDGSVDLMHIDGLRTYEAVHHDFENWLPKMSCRGVMLFHDVNVHRDDFGVWRLWREVTERYPHFEFSHCYGLGVLAIGKEIPDAVAELCAMDGTKDGAAVRSRVAFLGDRLASEAPKRVSIKSDQTPHYYQDDQRWATFEDLFKWFHLNVEIDPEWTVLEFGVGEHGFVNFYKRSVKRVIGLDIHDYSSFHPGIEFVLSNGKTIPLPDETVDLVVSHSVLEHVADVRQSIREIDRVLKIGGFAFLTVSPLYYSASGSHVNSPTPLDNWEHLDPSSPYYKIDRLKQGANLNKLTSQEMLSAVGAVPWDILRYEIRPEHKIAPDFALESGVPYLDLYTREFRLVAHRRTRITAQHGQFQDSPHPYLRGDLAELT